MLKESQSHTPRRGTPIHIASGGDFSKRTNATPVVISRCTLRLRSDAHISECEKALIQFERILRQRSDDEIAYEWANVCRDGLVISFDIYWYNERFFLERKEAYRTGAHPFVFQRFGAVADDFCITHELAPVATLCVVGAPVTKAVS